jgi:hypothetical protein
MKMRISIHLPICLAIAAASVGCKNKSAAPAASDEAKQQGDDKEKADDNQPGHEHRRKELDRKLDTNGDGVVSDEERTAVRRKRLQAMYARLDTDGDGKVTVAELQQGSGSGFMHFDDPAAVDTNHDGIISIDELETAFIARREKWRHRDDSTH